MFSLHIYLQYNYVDAIETHATHIGQPPCTYVTFRKMAAAAADVRNEHGFVAYIGDKALGGQQPPAPPPPPLPPISWPAACSPAVRISFSMLA